MGFVLDPPDGIDTQLVCPQPPAPALNSKMNFSYGDNPMCPGKIANYTCIAGGINAFQVKFSISFQMLLFDVAVHLYQFKKISSNTFKTTFNIN